MFVDTSVFVAILCKEPEAAVFATKLERAERRFTSPLVRLEACMVLATRMALADMPTNSARAAFSRTARSERPSGVRVRP